DMKGLRLRLWPARIIQKSWTGFGTEIHTIDFAEAYLALKQNVIEAITTPFDLIWPQKFSEVTKYITELRQIPMIEVVSINENVWQNLSAEHQNIIKAGLNKAGEWYNEKSLESVDSIIENKLLKEHNAAYIKVNREPFVDHCVNNVLPELLSDDLISKEWIEKVEKLR
ncbi:MAG: TRAP transporter substrate-binding protein DctP, partial [bacterium]